MRKTSNLFTWIGENGVGQKVDNRKIVTKSIISQEVIKAGGNRQLDLTIDFIQKIHGIHS